MKRQPAFNWGWPGASEGAHVRQGESVRFLGVYGRACHSHVAVGADRDL